MGASFGQIWLEMFAEIDGLGVRPRWRYGLTDRLTSQVEAFIAGTGLQIPTDTAVLYLYCWQALYGAVCTEVFGHLQWALSDAEDFFEGRLLEIIDLLGLGESSDTA